MWKHSNEYIRHDEYFHHVSRGCCANILMDTSAIVNVVTTQRCKRCTFDSSGLASESEDYPGLFAISENNAVGVVLLIALGWRQPTLGYVCSEGVNAVGVVLFLCGMPQKNDEE